MTSKPTSYIPIKTTTEAKKNKISVTTIFWARVLCSLVAEDACFRMRITLGDVFIRSLVFHLCVSESSENGFGMRPYLLVRSVSFLLFIPFPWRETKLFTRQVKVQSGEKYFILNNYKRNLPTLAGNKQLYLHFFLYRPRLFHLWTENIRV